jgi:hypothetical protein
MEKTGTLVKDAKYCSVHAAARQLGGVPSYVTLMKMARRGDIEGTWRIGNLTLIPQAWVDKMIKQAAVPDFLA